MNDYPGRLLAIGEFSAATQLSAKALRLYDESGVLRPVSVAASGYRYYSREQIATGRLVRHLREMDVPLAVIAQIVAAPRPLADALLARCAQQLDQRHARQKRQFQAGLALLHGAARADDNALVESTRAQMRVEVHALAPGRDALLETLQDHAQRTRSLPFCWLLDPPGDETARIELAVPVPGDAAPGIARELRAAPVLVHALPAGGLAQLEPTLDLMFDWLDRRGLRACEPPTLGLLADGSLQLGWVHESQPESRA